MSRARQMPVGDPILFALVIILAFFGIGMVYSAGVVDVPSLVPGLWRN